MKSKDTSSHKSFLYSFGKKRSTIVEFDISNENGRKAPKNVTLISNWRAYYPEHPQISSNSQGEYGFSGNGIFITNGDIQQIIKQIYQVIEEDEN